MLIQVYSAACVTLTYSQPCHIPNHGILRTGGIFKTLQNFDQAFSEPCHSQKEQFIQAIFSHIQVYSEPCVTLAHAEAWHIRNPGIFKPFHNCIPTHIQNPVTFTKIGKPCVTLEIQNPGILTILEYSELWHI